MEEIPLSISSLTTLLREAIKYRIPFKFSAMPVSWSCLTKSIVSANEELTRDLISIITSFSAKLYGLRSHKMKNILEAVKE